ncbi:hypothetical protein [Syntrophomonas palmitatica]|uniref:hypothetical protein n=1 Tax=Syntrophomonas palmitatica TaxID=402877 RepID=UPI0006D0E13B|nr:hypothetical protein [Syntrophomonas palmitatica]
MNLNEMLNRIYETIYSYEVQDIPLQVVDFFNELIEKQAININDIYQVQTYNRLMKNSLEAMQNMDYLLLADILEYELKPIFGLGNKN